jgi:hypothetical protein
MTLGGSPLIKASESSVQGVKRYRQQIGMAQRAVKGKYARTKSPVSISGQPDAATKSHTPIMRK